MLKNITFSADEDIIKRAREIAQKEQKSLNTVFRDWLKKYTEKETIMTDYQEIMNNLGYADPGKTFTRDEMNER